MTKPQPTQPTEEDYRLFFGRDHEYYYHKLERYRSGKKISFNLAAFFFGINWMLYRKLYRQTLLLVVLYTSLLLLHPLAVSYLGLDEVGSANLQLAYQFCIVVLIGFFGNYMYLRHALRKVYKIVNTSENEDEEIARLTGSGGTTLLPHIILAVIVVVLLLGA